ncbi:hypothetical protein Taro_042045 [Colocasia esculenta]|uniref:Uncharacterized protein n=1 Tax=Colocasia esculenta TaxID=4460 RepID=A0A843WHE3_COLES|nr:hypothetical protein [Colocasia esculenta]
MISSSSSRIVASKEGKTKVCVYSPLHIISEKSSFHDTSATLLLFSLAKWKPRRGNVQTPCSVLGALCANRFDPKHPLVHCCEHDRVGCRIMNVTVLGVTFWLPLLEGLLLHVRCVAHTGWPADVGHEKATAFSVAFRSRRQELYVRLRERWQWDNNLELGPESQKVPDMGLRLCGLQEWCWLVSTVSWLVLVERQLDLSSVAARLRGTSFRTCWGCVEKFLVAGEKEIIHTKPFFFPVMSAAICTDHLLEVNQSVGGYSAIFLTTDQLECFSALKIKLCGNKVVDLEDLEKHGMHNVVEAIQRLKWT